MITPRVHVIGGSVGGLMTGLILRRQGCVVDIHERSPVPLSGRGAGIVSHPVLLEALAGAGIAIDPASLGVRVHERCVLNRDGTAALVRPFEQLLTSWDRLFQVLRDAFPDAHYHLDRSFVGLEHKPDGVTAHFTDGTSISGDALIGADGFRSSVRGLLRPEQEPNYAGYIAWRGMVSESDISPATHRALFERFAFCLPDGEQILGYPVAGPDNDLRTGHRRYNFVWYRPAAADRGLVDLLTDATGKLHSVSIPPPLIRPDVIEDMRAASTRLLAPQFAEIVNLAHNPFFQPIYDYEAPRLAFDRVALMGDAAFVARPHVGAGVAKAGADAMALGRAFAGSGNVADALVAYHAERHPVGQRIIARARELGAYMQAQILSGEERRHAESNRTPQAVIEHTASLAFLSDN